MQLQAYNLVVKLNPCKNQTQTVDLYQNLKKEKSELGDIQGDRVDKHCAFLIP